MLNQTALEEIPTNELLLAARNLAAAGRENLVLLLRHILEIERREAFRPEYPSLFRYCVGELRFSEDEAARRVAAARAASTFPRAWTMLLRGDLSVSAMRMLAPVLSKENHRELLKAASGKSYREIERLVGSRKESVKRRDCLRTRGRLLTVNPPCRDPGLRPSRSSGTSPETAGRPEGNRGIIDDRFQGKEQPLELLPPCEPASAPDATRMAGEVITAVRFDAGEEFIGKLARAREVLRHKHPEGGFEEILTAALDVLLDRHDPERAFERRSKRRDRNRTRRGSKHSPPAGPRGRTRGIPAEVREAVYARDQGRCVVPLPSGRRCGSRDWIEIDHIVPFARGGSSEADNLRLACRACNQWLARREFGEAAISRGA